MTGCKQEGGTPVINTDFLHPEVDPHRISSPDFDPDGISYYVMRWGDYSAVRDKVLSQIQESGAKYDLLVYLLRGGKFPGIHLASSLSLPFDPWRSHLYSEIQAGKEAKDQKLSISQEVPNPDIIKGKRILAVDDVNHTSTTLNGLLAKLQALGSESVDIAVLHQKPNHRDRSLYCRYVGEETDAWIVYPWEHLGSDIHAKREFFYDKIPAWMIRESLSEAVPWSVCADRLKKNRIWRWRNSFNW